jgi:uncharacterized protein involved in response to NO
LLLVLAALWFVDATFMRALATGNLMLASRMLLVGLDIALLLITVIGGRIVPAFTANALGQRGITARVRSHLPLEAATIILMIAVLVMDVTWPSAQWAGALAGATAILHLMRLAGWQSRHTVRDPIVWVLHVSYLWIPIGLGLKAMYLIWNVSWASQWLHALAIGGAASMVVAVITRASLGHTGRPLTVSRSVAFAYGLLSAAALLRVLVDTTAFDREWMIRIAAVLWVVAFAMLLGTYAPILLSPRIDGKAG